MYIVRFPYNTKDKVHYASFLQEALQKGGVKKNPFLPGWGLGLGWDMCNDHNYKEKKINKIGKENCGEGLSLKFFTTLNNSCRTICTLIDVF